MEEKIRLETEKKKKDLAEQEVSLHHFEQIDLSCPLCTNSRFFSEIGNQNERT